MASVYWMGAVSDSWKTGFAWSDGNVPKSGDDVSIDVAGKYTVTVSAAARANSLLIDADGATLDVKTRGAMAVGGAITVEAGTLAIAGGAVNAAELDLLGGSVNLTGGTISGALINLAGGKFEASGGAVDGVTVEGGLDLSKGGSGALYVGSDGLVVTGAGGTGPGLVTEGVESKLYFEGVQTFNNATLLMTGNAEFTYLYADDTTGAGATLTLGAGVTVQAPAFNTVLSGVRGDETIVNDGAINVPGNGNSSTLFISPSAFINGGAITIGGKSSTQISPSNSFANAAGATIEVGTGSTLSIDAPKWSNAGAIVANSATINLHGQFSTSDLDGITDNNSSIVISGTVNNVGSTLAIGVGSSFPTIMMQGATVVGGVISDAGGGFVGTSATLNGVTFEGDLDLNTAGFLSVVGGLTVTGTGGVGAGIIDDTGSTFSGDTLQFLDTQSLDNVTIRIGDSARDSILSENATGQHAALLTLGPNVTIEHVGALAEIESSSSAGDGVLNEGTIDADFAGGTLSFGQGAFTNQGTIKVSNGDTVDLEPNSFTNLAKTTLNGGLYEVDAGSTLLIKPNAAVTVDNATIILSGAGSTFQGEFAIDATLTNITSAGALELLSGRNWTSTRTIVNAGTLVLGGGVFDTVGLVDVVGSTLTGFGAVASPFTGSGAVSASGGALVFTGVGNAFDTSLGGDEIDLVGGTDTLGVGSSFAAATIGVSGGAVVTLGADQTFSGNWNQNGSAVDLSGFGLALAGASDFAGATVAGPGTLSVGDGTVAGLALSGGASLSDTGNIGQTGQVTVGDAAGLASELLITSGSVYDIDGDTGIARGTSAASRIVDSGTLIKMEGTGVSTVAVFVSDLGLVEAASGTLHLSRGISGSGALQVDAGATLECGGSAAAGLTASFNGAGATLALDAAVRFAATIAGFAAGDAIDLIKTVATGASINGADQLVIINGAATVATLQLSGDYAGATFATTSDGKGGTLVTIDGGAAAAPPGEASPAPHAFIAAAARLGADAGGAHVAPTAPIDDRLSLLATPRSQVA